ncbi:MAG: hypothetical protein QXR61_04005 [Candidatus Bathyarchaeia archaeon]
MKRFIEYALLFLTFASGVYSFNKGAKDLAFILFLLVIYLVLRRFEE